MESKWSQISVVTGLSVEQLCLTRRPVGWSEWENGRHGYSPQHRTTDQQPTYLPPPNREVWRGGCAPPRKFFYFLSSDRRVFGASCCYFFAVDYANWPRPLSGRQLTGVFWWHFDLIWNSDPWQVAWHPWQLPHFHGSNDATAAAAEIILLYRPCCTCITTHL